MLSGKAKARQRLVERSDGFVGIAVETSRSLTMSAMMSGLSRVQTETSSTPVSFEAGYMRAIRSVAPRFSSARWARNCPGAVSDTSQPLKTALSSRSMWYG